MAAMSRGLSVKARSHSKPKSGTSSSRKHHFESFSQRIAKLKIEPVRRGRNAILDDAELDTTFSYFKNSLEEWKDHNTSEAFTSFVRQVTPLCESLPQILYHDERILELLLQYMEKGDTWSEEPLLSLMSHFAHDLGARFEKHFSRVVRTVSRLAATHQAVEVIEWSFTCLAWLFKYLSRLLVSDLRPVFDLMAPLLGKEHQKQFVTRFAAESLSFLVRKAGAVYHKDKEPLKLFIGHISDQLDKLQGGGKDFEFQQGLMSLFADSMKGIQRGFHSSAVAILKELLLQTYDPQYSALLTPPLELILFGVLIANIHHSDAENFGPLVEIVLEHIKKQPLDASFNGLSARLIYVVCGVRKGSRIASWKSVMETLRILFERMNNAQITDQQYFLSSCAVSFQYCPVDAAISNVQLLDKMTRTPWEPLFVRFCNLYADLGIERFGTLLLPYLKRFIAQKANDYRDELYVLLPKLCLNNALPEGSVQSSTLWNDYVVQQFSRMNNSSQPNDQRRVIVYECNAFLDAARILNIPVGIKSQIAEHLLASLQQALAVENTESIQPNNTLAAGNGFMFIVQERSLHQSVSRLWSSLCHASSIYKGSLQFWQALLVLMESHTPFENMTDLEKETLKNNLILCLGSSSHGLRLVALEILEKVLNKHEDLRDVISTALLIEQTPLNLENARSVAMRTRQLAKTYPLVSSNEWVGEAIPAFCFGLLHVKFAQVWDDACSALKEMCNTKEGERHISRIAFEWLDGSTAHENDTIADGVGDRPKPRYATEFECTNVMQLDEKVVTAQTSFSNIKEHLRATFERQHETVTFVTPSSRTQALRLLNAIPHLAEKRSRQLVPVLLKWAFDQPVLDDVRGDLTSEAIPECTGIGWSRRDQKSLLSLFSKFTNPKVLFKSSDVYSALLVLLGNGDVDIQKAALKAILTWKEPAISRSQENLYNLLDDARFREEISVFMDVSEEESQLREEHRGQLLPVILRLLYGKVVSGNKGQEAKRKAVFAALTRFEEDAIRQFLVIAFGPLAGISILKDGHIDNELLQRALLSPRKQIGLLNMLEDMLNTLKNTLAPFTSIIVDPLLLCLIRASREISTSQTTTGIEDSSQQQNTQLSLFRTIRQRAYHSLNILSETCPDFAWEAYAKIIVEELVNPRLQQFPTETAQSVSGTLRLFAAWSKSPKTALFLVKFNTDVIGKVVDCLEVPSAKDEVKLFVLDNVLLRIISLVADVHYGSSMAAKLERNQIQSDVLQPYASLILNQIGKLLRKSPSKELLESGVRTVAEMASHIVGSAESRSMIEIATFLIRQPSKRVNFQTKFGLLKIMHEFIPRADSKDLDELFDTAFDAVCSLFTLFRDRPSRTMLCDILQDLSEYRDELRIIAQLCHDLNSFSASKLDEPDFDRRSKAFGIVNGEGGKELSILQWKPLVYNMLYYIKDNDELSIRVNASLALRRFVDASVHDDSFKGFISAAVLPGIQDGMRELSELVRIEYLGVLAHLVEKYPAWPPVADLQVLLTGEEESSFFSNILHIQSHRRLRALRRLASSASQIQPSNIHHLIVPLLEHFYVQKTEDHNLTGEAIKTVAVLCLWLEWPQYRSLLKKYVGYLSTKEDMQKTIIKLLAGLLDSLNQAGRSKGYLTAVSVQEPNDTRTESQDNEIEVQRPISVLAKTLPQQQKFTADLTDNFLPPLAGFLRKKDESAVSLRVPIAIALIKVLLVLPPRDIEKQLPAILLDICHILKSRSQEGRDMARNTLAEIAILTGAPYIGFILKSLRTALHSGYQRHVLSFTMHHILVKMSPEMAPGALDYCLAEIVDIIMDDIFGAAGQEKDAEGYISKMKEVKSSKSYDSLDIIARFASPSHFVEMILPIKALLQERLNSKQVQKLDELLRRVGMGILQNPVVKDRDILIFCYELFQDVYTAGSQHSGSKTDDPRSKRYLINIRGAAKSGVRGSSSSHLYKITRFSLDVLRTVLRKHEELQTPQNLAGFLPILGDALVQGQEEVQVSAIRLLTTIIKVPLVALDNDCPVYVTEAVRTIRGAHNTNSELAQASLKLISAVLRERPNVEVKERDLAFLLKRLIPDLDEPDRQGVTFAFLKAVMNRKIVLAEVYEIMDKVGAMMITNHTRTARDLARSQYFHFLMDYPQAKSRFNKQLEFLVRNLRYDHVEGRQSVMEALNLVLTKVGDSVLQDYLGMLFLPLINSMANDDSSDCRTMAGTLIKKLFERADAKELKGFTADLKQWLEQDEDTGLRRLSIQCWGLYFEVTGGKAKELAIVLRNLQSTIETCLERQHEDDWELIYYSLTVLSKICKTYPDITLASDKRALWAAVQSSVSYPHAWVKLAAAKLLGTFFADLAVTNGDGGLDRLPLRGSRQLQLSEERMLQLTNAFLKNLSNPNVTEELCSQSVRNLAFLARCFAANGAHWNWQKVDDDDEVEDITAEGTESELNGDTALSDEEWGGLSPKPPTAKKNSVPQSALHRLISRLSGIIRRETKIMKLASLFPKSAVMTLLETLTSKLPVESLSSSLPHLLTTLSTLTDPATTAPRSTDPAFNETYQKLIEKAREVLATLQKRLGTSKFLSFMQDVQKGVKQRREDRRTKRKIEAITMPEKHNKEKKRRHDVQKKRRKEKNAENIGKRRGW